MADWLLSVGLDVGTTSTQMIVSQLKVENASSGFTVPQMVIAQREIRYRSPVHFTPLIGENLVDGQGIREIVLAEYQKAGISRQDVDTGAVIITGETSRKENAGAVLQALSDFAGDFVVATAGPDLESILAAKGAGAAAFSDSTGKPVLHMDIGGGTSNLALIRDGKIVQTGCLNVGGRLIKLDSQGKITYVSPVLQEIATLKVGQIVSQEQVRSVAQILVQALEMVAGLREKTPLLEKLVTQGSSAIALKAETGLVISFSGGVADCIEKQQPWLAFGDMGPILGQEIRKSRLCQGQYRLGEETIRATVIGAGCHSAQLSGSTVFHKNVEFPLKNRPVVRLTEQEQVLPEQELAVLIEKRLAQQDTLAVLALPGLKTPNYAAVKELASAIVTGVKQSKVLVAVERDMAKALGQAMALKLPPDGVCLCIDSVQLEQDCFLDVGAPVGPAMPVVVKTLVLER